MQYIRALVFHNEWAHVPVTSHCRKTIENANMFVSFFKNKFSKSIVDCSHGLIQSGSRRLAITWTNTH